MLTWIVAIAALILVWGRIWTRNLELAMGILIGLPIAWLLSKLLAPYVTGMEELPIWIAPLPVTTVALLLLIKGALVWARGNDALPKPAPDEHEQH
jgi:hypothetical protein